MVLELCVQILNERSLPPHQVPVSGLRILGGSGQLNNNPLREPGNPTVHCGSALAASPAHETMHAALDAGEAETQSTLHPLPSAP